ncbi:Ert1p KNAG_0M00640 [Huiozyma naganishii CBS 8797]|uniref:Zn(2)-C6 fungal-type domain-containing protein n=1 Tax=Huiozyma naganishii (strain ATCC MYA-139 / BCRC 22969 / CBS 8797 / KCTC 17520 / NBRC 10181 / NCYC 3082 / Yp74L-3) TaxID=1071383 RepID=J7S3Z4_HUIN7|nr:hypothetical protein KNAG_0M00640 [Kazachstania naganishii CBS 8797]CCK72917.1 hypothetical protein KNAG_0M00640 [Kazachstania naganishii CBS 8797]
MSGLPIEDEPTATTPQSLSPSPSANTKVRGRRKNTNVACVNCSKLHVSCDSNRPCKRCSEKGLKDTCVDAPRKRTKYLAGIPASVLPLPLVDDPGRQAPFIQTARERQHFYNKQHIMHKPRFMSNAADSEYSILSNITQRDNLVSQIPVDNILYSDLESPNGVHSSQSDILLNNTTARSSPEKNDGAESVTTQYNGGRPVTISAQQYPSSYQNVYSVLLGPHAQDIINSQVDLFSSHFALFPVVSPNNSLNFKRLVPQDPAINHGDLQRNSKINQYYLNSDTLMFPEVMGNYHDSPQSHVSFALECKSPEPGRLKSNPNWAHSLRYSTPMEIYTSIREPFSHTPGFRHLLMYLRSRFSRSDIVQMCQCMAEFRPIFIACSVTLTEEDMIFMEQCYQRTLLEYAKFLEQIGTPTCVWRRNGQISYVNEEFEILTGWKREELLNKMTFIVEILDDQSVRDYFRTFSSVAYKDFRGTEQMRVCNILSPIAGKTVRCVCMWTLKRDISGLPLMILGNFMPIL